MNNFTKKNEYVLWILLIATIGLKYLNFEGVVGLPPILIVLAGSIGMLYFVFCVAIFSEKKPEEKITLLNFIKLSRFRTVLSFYFGFCFMLLIFSALFKIMFWPGSDFLGKVAFVFIFFGIFLLLFFEKEKDSRFFKSIVNRTVLISCFAAIFYYAKVDDLVDIQWRNYPRYAAAKKICIKEAGNQTCRKDAAKILEEEKLDRNSQ